MSLSLLSIIYIFFSLSVSLFLPERKKEASDYRQQHKISSNLESRLGPLPNDRRPQTTGGGGQRYIHEHVHAHNLFVVFILSLLLSHFNFRKRREAKGSAIEIAEAFR